MDIECYFQYFFRSFNSNMIDLILLNLSIIFLYYEIVSIIQALSHLKNDFTVFDIFLLSLNIRRKDYDVLTYCVDLSMTHFTNIESITRFIDNDAESQAGSLQMDLHRKTSFNLYFFQYKQLTNTLMLQTILI